MDLNQKTYLLVTGASRGIGKEIAIQLARKVQQSESIVVLMGRNEKDLNETKSIILQEAMGNGLIVHTYTLELLDAQTKDFAQILHDSLECQNPDDFDRAIIIHNAATVGDLTEYARDAADINKWDEYYRTNLFSAIALNCEFMRIFTETVKLVVNLSTKCAVEPFASMAYYCSSKAARDMYFRVLALEEPSETTFILNYAPGAIDTQMTQYLQHNTHNKEMADAFRKQRESNSMLTASQTTEKLIAVLEAQEFSSGDHVDYWD